MPLCLTVLSHADGACVLHSPRDRPSRRTVPAPSRHADKTAPYLPLQIPSSETGSARARTPPCPAVYRVAHARAIMRGAEGPHSGRREHGVSEVRSEEVSVVRYRTHGHFHEDDGRALQALPGLREQGERDP